jgi:hypothetical protein
MYIYTYIYIYKYTYIYIERERIAGLRGIHHVKIELQW